MQLCTLRSQVSLCHRVILDLFGGNICLLWVPDLQRFPLVPQDCYHTVQPVEVGLGNTSKLFQLLTILKFSISTVTNCDLNPVAVLHNIGHIYTETAKGDTFLITFVGSLQQHAATAPHCVCRAAGWSHSTKEREFESIAGI